MHGQIFLPGKVTSVPGVRRGGKTTFVHQLGRERLAGIPRALLPYINFEKDLIEKEADLGPKIERAFARFPILPPPDERISACIIGVA